MTLFNKDLGNEETEEINFGKNDRQKVTKDPTDHWNENAIWFKAKEGE